MIFETIKGICKEKGIPISTVEKKAGLSNGSISKWNEHSPTVENLKAVADVLKVNVNKLI